MSKFAIYRHPFGISLNGREFALDSEDGDIIAFESVESALKWANSVCPDVDVTDEEVLNEEVGLFICDLNEAEEYRVLQAPGADRTMH